jgi:hypothetical protein
VTLYESADDLRVKFLEIRDTPGYRAALVRDILAFKQTLIANSVGVVSAQMRAMLESEAKGDYCDEVDYSHMFDHDPSHDKIGPPVSLSRTSRVLSAVRLSPVCCLSSAVCC